MRDENNVAENERVTEKAERQSSDQGKWQQDDGKRTDGKQTAAPFHTEMLQGETGKQKDTCEAETQCQLSASQCEGVLFYTGEPQNYNSTSCLTVSTLAPRSYWDSGPEHILLTGSIDLWSLI